MSAVADNIQTQMPEPIVFTDEADARAQLRPGVDGVIPAERTVGLLVDILRGAPE